MIATVGWEGTFPFLPPRTEDGHGKHLREKKA